MWNVVQVEVKCEMHKIQNRIFEKMWNVISANCEILYEQEMKCAMCEMQKIK